VSGDIPLFRNTEEAEKFGRELRRVIAPDEFQTLVRTWMVSELAAREAINPQAKANLAFRSQTLREAVQTFLLPDGLVVRPLEIPEVTARLFPEPALLEVGGS
jgi:hypothetical protein